MPPPPAAAAATTAQQPRPATSSSLFPPSLSVHAPPLPDHPQLLHRDKHGEHTVWVSPDCPHAMDRPGGQWLLSDFTLKKQLYKGKASTLYQATDKVSGATVALKSYSKRRLSTLNWYQVEREIRLHAQLRHPNVIQLHAAFESDDYVFMIAEFAAGGDLYEDLKRQGGQMGEGAVAGEVLPPFIAAIAHMHANTIVHRDIKPENILLMADRTLKVADFGLSINWAEERPVTRAGTLDYMSPEVLLCPEKSRPEENKGRFELGYTDAVDVWAAGVLAYELLVGRPPFERESREETQQLIASRAPTLPSWLSEGAKDFISVALAKSARRRPSMAQLAHHPWILEHSRRRSQPAPADLHLPLHDLAGGAGASPFSDLHRVSLHGANSCREFSALLMRPGTVGSLLPPALSIEPVSLNEAAAAAISATASPGAAARPTTSSSRLGRPITPGAAALAAAAPPAAPEKSAEAASLAHLPSLHKAPSMAAAEAPPAAVPGQLAAIPEHGGAGTGHLLTSAIQRAKEGAVAAAEAAAAGGGGSISALRVPVEAALETAREVDSGAEELRQAAAAGAAAGPAQHQRQALARPSSTIAKSASALFGRLLGKKPAVPRQASGLASAASTPRGSPALTDSASPPKTAVPASPRGTPAGLQRSPSSSVLRRPPSVKPAGSSPVRVLPSPRGAALPAADSCVAPSGASSTPGGPLSSAMTEAAEGRVQRVDSKSAGVRCAGLAPAEPSMDAQDLIPAHHGTSETGSFMSAFSSLHASSLPSLPTAPGAASPTRISRKGSKSLHTSRKGSTVVAGLPAGKASASHAAAAAGAHGGGPRAGPSGRSAKTASMPGDKAAGPAGCGPAGSEGEEAVQRSAASWSHPAAALKRSPSGKASAASSARLGMYKALVHAGAKPMGGKGAKR